MSIIKEEASHAKDITAVLRQTGWDVDDRAADLIDELRAAIAAVRRLISNDGPEVEALPYEIDQCLKRFIPDEEGSR